MYWQRIKGFTRKNFSKKNLGGFTLIELLVVIAIIGVLSGVVLSSLNSARAKGRDAKRAMDIHQINNALALYYDDHQCYPDCAGGTSPIRSNNATDWESFATALTEYIKTFPIDPLNNSTYYYTYKSTDVLNTEYTLTAQYERQESDPRGTFSPYQVAALNYRTNTAGGIFVNTIGLTGLSYITAAVNETFPGLLLGFDSTANKDAYLAGTQRIQLIVTVVNQGAGDAPGAQYIYTWTNPTNGPSGSWSATGAILRDVDLEAGSSPWPILVDLWGSYAKYSLKFLP